MAKDKKVKKLTESQNILIDTLLREAKEEFKKVVHIIQIALNKPLRRSNEARLMGYMANFRRELDVAEDWIYDDQKREFRAPKNDE